MKFGSRKYNLRLRKYDNRSSDHMDLLQPRSSCLQHHVHSTYVYTYQPRCTLNQGHHPSAEMYLRPRSTSISRDVPSTEVDIHRPRCTFDRGRHPSAEMYLRPRSTSFGQDVPSTEVDILRPRCTFDRGRHPSAGLYLVRRTADSTEAKNCPLVPEDNPKH